MKLFFFFITISVSYILPASAQDIDILYGVKIKVRDGVQLNATVYKPHEQKQSLPVILQVTPYVSDSYHSWGVNFAKNGYVHVIVDSRGRGNSEGFFDPAIQEARDCYDVVEWLAIQKYCNGKVAMWGGSYSGTVQWSAAKEFPPHLKTIVPVASPKMGYDFPIQNNVWNPYAMQWLTAVTAKTDNGQIFNDREFWVSKFGERFQKDLPFKSLDTLIGNPNAIFQKWIEHSTFDDYYKIVSPSPAQFAKMDLPIITITGHYDGDQVGALAYYKEFMQYASPLAKSKHYLIIGPWDHGSTGRPKKEIAGLIFGDASVLDMNVLHKQWYDYVLKNGAKPEFLKDQIAYFVSNRNTWKYASSLDEIGKTKQILYLNSNSNKAPDVFQSAVLQPIFQLNNLPTDYTYNPLDKTLGSIEFGTGFIEDNYIIDQKLAYNLGKAGVIYHSAQFESETEVSGFFEPKAYIETNVKDVDIMANVYEIKADGSSVLLTTQIMRARYKDHLEKEKLLKPGEVNLFHFKNFPFISRVIEKGSRLRLIITSPNSIYDQKNYCSGGVVTNETAQDAHTANIKIYNDVKYKSALIVPMVKN